MVNRIEQALTWAAGLAALGAVAGVALVILGAVNDWPTVDMVGQVLFAPAAAAILVTGLLMCLRMYLSPIAWLVARLWRR